MAPSLLGRLFRQRGGEPCPADDGLANAGAILRAHVLTELTTGRIEANGAAVGRFHGVSLTLHDCAGGDAIDPIEERDDVGFYRCQVCEQFFVVRFKIEPRAAALATPEEGER